MSSPSETVLVAIRFRGLNAREVAATGGKVWKVMKRIMSVTQTAPDGVPLKERSAGRTFFTYDKVRRGLAMCRDTVMEQCFKGACLRESSGLSESSKMGGARAREKALLLLSPSPPSTLFFSLASFDPAVTPLQ